MLTTVGPPPPEQQNRLLAFNAKLTGLAEGIFLTLWLSMVCVYLVVISAERSRSLHLQIWTEDKVLCVVNTKCLLLLSTALCTALDCHTADSPVSVSCFRCETSSVSQCSPVLCCDMIWTACYTAGTC